jgi:hypothetical protein
MADRELSFSLSVHGPLRRARATRRCGSATPALGDRQWLLAHRSPTLQETGSPEYLQHDNGGLHDGARDIAVRNLTGDARR